MIHYGSENVIIFIRLMLCKALPRSTGKEQHYFAGRESLVYLPVPIRNTRLMFPCSSTVIVKTGRLVGMQSQVWVGASAVDPDNDSTFTHRGSLFTVVTKARDPAKYIPE